MPHGVQRADDIAPAFSAFKGHVDAIYFVENAMIDINRARIIALALDAKVPVVAGSGDFAKAGVSCVLRTELPQFVPTRRRDC